jgi:hypothetical protein
MLSDLLVLLASLLLGFVAGYSISNELNHWEKCISPQVYSSDLNACVIKLKEF